MARLLVTGAAGFIGAEIVEQARAAGYDVVGLDLPGEPLEGLAERGVPVIAADVTQPRALSRAFRGVTHCIHTAGNTSLYRSDRARLLAVNVEGVANVVRTAQQAGVRRLVHTSSVAAIGYDPTGAPCDERRRYNWPRGLPYMETKRDGERLALGAASASSFEVVVLNPATVYGPRELERDDQNLVRELQRERLRVAPSGGMTICDVADVAAAHLAALEQGRSGERYILGGPHVEHRELFAVLAKELGVRAPRIIVPGRALRAAGRVLSWGELHGLHTRVPAAALRLGGLHLYHASDKAVRELGYRLRPLAEIARRTIAAALGP